MSALKRALSAFNTFVVMKEDFDYLATILTNQIMQRAFEFAQQKGVLKGHADELEVYNDSGTLKISTGAAYIQGERAEVASVQSLAITEGEDVAVWLQHAQTADSSGDATRLDDVGNPHTVWYTDGYLIGKTAWATWNYAVPADKILLAHVTMTSGVITVVNHRVWLTLGLPLPDASVLTAMLANLAVTNGKIGNGAVTAGKIASNTVLEANMAAGSDVVPLIEDLATQPAAGQDVDPLASIAYYCDTGNAYEYKVRGRVLRKLITAAGPVRRLRLDCNVQVPGTGTATIYLVAWTDAPGSIDPDSPSFDGVMAYGQVVGPLAGPDYDQQFGLSLDVSGLSLTNYAQVTYGLVLRNDTTLDFSINKVTLVALR